MHFVGEGLGPRVRFGLQSLAEGFQIALRGLDVIGEQAVSVAQALQITTQGGVVGGAGDQFVDGEAKRQRADRPAYARAPSRPRAPEQHGGRRGQKNVGADEERHGGLAHEEDRSGG